MKQELIEKIRSTVLDSYIETGKHLFVSDLMDQFNTSAQGIRNALGYDDFVFEVDSRWQGSNYAGKFVNAPCVEPTKLYLAKTIKSFKSL